MGETDVMETRIRSVEKRVDKLENGHEYLAKQLAESRESQIETKVLVRETRSDVSDVKASVAKLFDIASNQSTRQSNDEVSQTSKWEQFYGKAFWAIIGGLISIGVYLISGVMHH